MMDGRRCGMMARAVSSPFLVPSGGWEAGADSVGWVAKARKLKVLTVDKGLLREVKEVQKMVNAITLCKVRPLPNLPHRFG